MFTSYKHLVSDTVARVLADRVPGAKRVPMPAGATSMIWAPRRRIVIEVQGSDDVPTSVALYVSNMWTGDHASRVLPWSTDLTPELLAQTATELIHAVRPRPLYRWRDGRDRTESGEGL